MYSKTSLVFITPHRPLGFNGTSKFSEKLNKLLCKDDAHLYSHGVLEFKGPEMLIY
jgi:hypothetical protein